MKSWTLVVAMAGCGASAAEIRSAHEATYAMDPPHLMQIAMEVANDQVGIAAVDLRHHVFVTKSFLAADGGHRGWPGYCARGGWQIAVNTTDAGRSFVTITPLAQASRTVCHVRWTGGTWTPSWFDVDPDAVGLRPTLENGADRLAVAIHERASE